MPQPAFRSCIILDHDTASLTHHEMLRLVCSEQRQLKKQVDLLVKQNTLCQSGLSQCGERLGNADVHSDFHHGGSKVELECQPMLQGCYAKEHLAHNAAPKEIEQIVQQEPKRRERFDFHWAARPSTTKSLDDINSELQQALKRVKKFHTRGPSSSKSSIASPEHTSKPGMESILGSIVTHPAFDSVAAAIIIFNAVLVAASVECLTTQPDEELWMAVAAHVCNIFFFVELVLRLAHQGRFFFLSEDKVWNVVDFFLVVLSVVDLFQIPGDVSLASSVRTLKMLRVVRMFRIFRFFTELSQMASMIASSLTSALWAGILICIIMFTFTVYFTQQTTNFLVREQDEDLRNRAHRFFGSVPRTFYSLMQAMLGGKSWGEYTDVLSRYSFITVLLFLAYVAFMLLAVLNVITGVFVDTAREAAGEQRDFMIAQEMNIRQKYVLEMKNLFPQIDVDGSETITLEEVKGFFNQDKWAAYFSALGIDVTDVELLFFLLDHHGKGALEIEEFVEGLLRIKGDAKRMDCAVIINSLARVEAILKSHALFCNKDKCASAASSAPSQQR